MRSLRIVLRFAITALFGLCAADGISQVRGLRLMPIALENIAVAVFFLLAVGAVVLAWMEKDRGALGRIRLWAGLVLALSVALLILLWIALAAEFPAFWLDVLFYALAIVATPVVSCSVMFWPIFGWVLILAASWKLCREMDKSHKERWS